MAYRGIRTRTLTMAAASAHWLRHRAANSNESTYQNKWKHKRKKPNHVVISSTEFVKVQWANPERKNCQLCMLIVINQITWRFSWTFWGFCVNEQRHIYLLRESFFRLDKDVKLLVWDVLNHRTAHTDPRIVSNSIIFISYDCKKCTFFFTNVLQNLSYATWKWLTSLLYFIHYM